jgi:hypothetical protein
MCLCTLPKELRIDLAWSLVLSREQIVRAKRYEVGDHTRGVSRAC